MSASSTFRWLFAIHVLFFTPGSFFCTRQQPSGSQFGEETLFPLTAGLKTFLPPLSVVLSRANTGFPWKYACHFDYFRCRGKLLFTTGVNKCLPSVSSKILFIFKKKKWGDAHIFFQSRCSEEKASLSSIRRNCEFMIIKYSIQHFKNIPGILHY